MALHVSETNVSLLPEKVREWLEEKLSVREKVLFCAFGGEYPRVDVVVITDYKLILYCGNRGVFASSYFIRQPINWERGHYVILLENLHGAWVEKDSGRWLVAILQVSVVKNSKKLFGDGYSLTYAFTASFEDKAVANRLSTTLSKAITEMNIRLRTPLQGGTAAVDIADQLMKLAALRDKGDLTQAEFEAAKKKLLGS